MNVLKIIQLVKEKQMGWIKKLNSIWLSLCAKVEWLSCLNCRSMGIRFFCFLVLLILLTLCRSYFVTCRYSEPGVNMTDGTCTSNAGCPRCSKHNRLCSLRVVRKDGENKGRQFYTCPLPKGIQCDYFEVSTGLQSL